MTALAVDVGTSMIKTVLFSDNGDEVTVSRQATEVQRPQPGWAEQDMMAVWNAVLFTIRSVLPQAATPVQFLSITAQGDGCWLVDEDGAPTGPAILWSDGRAADIVDTWRDEGLLEKAFRCNGSLTFPGLPNAILTWLASHDPGRLERSAVSLYAGGWLYLRFTGRCAVDESDASAPFLDLRSRTYAPEIRSMFGMEWAERLMPDVCSDDQRAGKLSPQAAAELGLPEGLPVVLAPYDIVSTSIGAGATSPGQACTILGTTLCTEVVRDTVDTDGEPAGLTIALDSHGKVLRAFPTLAGAEVLVWAAELLSVSHPRDLVTLSEQSVPGARGLVFLPYLSPAGERAPFLDTHARGTFWGLSLEHGRADIARAVLEGLTLVIRDCLEASGARTEELRVCGGGAANMLWCKLIADVVGVRVVRSADSESGAKGAFLAGLVATGAAPDLEAAAIRYVRTHTSCDPDPDRAAFYTSLYREFRQLRDVARRGWEIQAQPKGTPEGVTHV
ncbi:FGGY-family carbohydrate kinase [Hoyosella subflava]|uniref:Pentulose/hexulose kinase n=1 Tax=Hoyosella subflava (strain DSM 45089 / JCM 17490 / NBRC 109087 / DQS3-9A1) TaxID=443218 RepID=F6EJX5_HOYSD|nr:FGGY-family carbohydrate kinase [Hoyosella subflava]AEF41333.1 Pentulose/hexulose kinase [Hoyosella subflava DQS3-9A1]